MSFNPRMYFRPANGRKADWRFLGRSSRLLEISVLSSLDSKGE